MKSWEVLEIAIPRKQSERVAQLLSVSADYVRRWRREPEGADSPTASGQRSILDRVTDLMDAVFLVNPSGVAMIVEFINAHYQQLVDTHSTVLRTPKDCAKQSAQLLREATDAINRLAVEGCDSTAIFELVELRDEATRAILNVQRTMREENTLQ